MIYVNGTKGCIIFRVATQIAVTGHSTYDKEYDPCSLHCNAQKVERFFFLLVRTLHQFSEKNVGIVAFVIAHIRLLYTVHVDFTSRISESFPKHFIDNLCLIQYSKNEPCNVSGNFTLYSYPFQNMNNVIKYIKTFNGGNLF